MDELSLFAAILMFRSHIFNLVMVLEIVLSVFIFLFFQLFFHSESYLR